ncbi:MAG: putative alpha/beta-hydrolase family hydrolase [Kiritimatiellia bacterium]|jgi:predicted alpha/beta-hydrolase family hydrolase
MVRWADRLGQLGPVTTFDYPYVQRGNRAPDRLPKLLIAHRAQLDALHPSTDDPVVLIGKSMGSRVGCHLANDTDAAGVICLGYPLRTLKGSMRDEVLLSMTTPILFVQGTRDRLCPLDLLDTVRNQMTASNFVHVVQEGDHSLAITKRHTKATGETQQDSDDAVFAAIRSFVTQLR